MFVSLVDACLKIILDQDSPVLDNMSKSQIFHEWATNVLCERYSEEVIRDVVQRLRTAGWDSQAAFHHATTRDIDDLQMKPYISLRDAIIVRLLHEKAKM